MLQLRAPAPCAAPLRRPPPTTAATAAPLQPRRSRPRLHALPEDAPPPPPLEEQSAEPPGEPRRRRKADSSSSDPVASFLTRRFGLAGGLAWLGVLLFGVVSEQLKTRGEVARARDGTRPIPEAERKEVTTPSGLRYTDVVAGGGEETPRRGYLLALDLSARNAAGASLYDSAASGRQLALVFGSRLTGALCVGVEEALSSMRAGGVRELRVPGELAFPGGARFPGGEVGAGEELFYTIKLVRVSPPPS